MATPAEHQQQALALTALSEASRRTILCLFVSLILIGVLLQLDRVSSLYFTSGDDIYMGTLAERIRQDGWSHYWNDSRMYSYWQGRPYFYVNFFFFILPYLTHSPVLRTILIVASQAAAIGAVSWFFSLFFGRLSALLFASIVISLLPLWPTVHALSAHFVVYQIPILLFFSGLGLYVTVLRSPNLHKTAATLRSLAGLTLIFFSFMFYEALYLPFFLITAAALVAGRRSPNEPFSLRSLLRPALPLLGVYSLWSAIYLVYRVLHPSTYVGSSLAPFDLGNILRSLSQNAVKSLPGGNLANLPWTDINPSFGDWRSLSALLSSNLLLVSLLQSSALGALLFFVGRSPVLPPQNPAPPRPRWLLAAAFAAFLGWITPLPLALSVKHANMSWNLRPYLPGYFQFLAFAACLAILLSALTRFRRGSSSQAAHLAAALALALLTTAAGTANGRVSSFLSSHSRPWKLMDLLCQSGLVERLPSGATILAPSLWLPLDPSAWYNEDYWSRFVQARTPRKIRFLRTPAELGDSLSAELPSLFYAEHLELPGRTGSVLLLTSELRGTGPRRSADRATLLSDHNLSGSQLVYSTQTANTARSSPLQFSYAHGSYAAIAYTPAMLIGTACLAQANTLEDILAPVSVEFSGGFSMLERDPARYWRWADGPSGKATLSLVNNSNRPVKVLFSAAFLSNPEPTTYEWTFQAQSGSFQARHGDTHTWELLLAPGRNDLSIQSRGSRIPAPQDPRYLVFGLQNWQLRAVDSSR